VLAVRRFSDGVAVPVSSLMQFVVVSAETLGVLVFEKE
jgi:hypothetical protein